MTAGIPFSLTMTIGIQVYPHQKRLWRSITRNTRAARSLILVKTGAQKRKPKHQREGEREREVWALLSAPLKNSYSVGFASRLPVFLPSLSSSFPPLHTSSSLLFPYCSLSQPLCCVSRLLIAATRWLLMPLCDQNSNPPPKKKIPTPAHM